MTQPKKLPLERNLEAYKDIELTQEEIDAAMAEAMLMARQRKSAELKQQEYAKKVFEKKVFEKVTAEQLKQKFIDSGGILDQFNEEAFWQMALYFTNDDRCTLDFKKGLFLFGNVGCGKTSFMHFFKYNQNCSYIVQSAREITYQYAEHGHESIRRYNGLIKFSDTNLSFGQSELGVCFDDIGTEVDKKNYGNQSNVMADILLNRYDNHNLLRGKTHITTNLNGNEIELRYGTRVRSRMREMFNLIVFDKNSPDRRK